MHTLAIAAVAVALIAFAWWYSQRAASTPTVTYVADTTSQMWTSEGLGAYTCQGSTATGYCVLPTEAAAQAQCSPDPKCLGYLYYTNSPKFGYQLFTKTPTVPGYNTAVSMTKKTS